ncbi:MAG: ribosome maturation factor RimP [Clostridium lundense]|nr:ribosome maturation factor RimP [Clostridium lundense]
MQDVVVSIQRFNLLIFDEGAGPTACSLFYGPGVPRGQKGAKMAGLKTDELILAALEEGAAGQGLDIVSVELSGPAAHPTLRVRVDLLEGGLIDMDRVTACTPWVGEVVEALDPFPGAYELEVSSPGIERPLRRARDFARFAGERAEVVTREPVQERRNFTGTIVGATEEAATIEVDGVSYEVPIASMKSAKLKPDFAKIFAAAKKAAKEAGFDENAEVEDEGDDE